MGKGWDNFSDIRDGRVDGVGGGGIFHYLYLEAADF